MKKIIYFLLLISINYYLISDETDDLNNNKDQLTFEDVQKKYESENPVFLQKGGMLRPGEHSFYLRTNDEYTGFSTLFIGYRYGLTNYFNFGIEGGASPIPHVYLAAIILHFKIYETPNKFLFVGVRSKFGYKYQDIDMTTGFWPSIVGDNYLKLTRNGLYFIPEFTVAFRFGKYRRFALYHTIYPRFDFDFFDRDNPVYVLFSPITAGFEVRFPKKRFGWSFAVEAGYAFPLPWNSIPAGKWVNFPSLANISFNYKFGDKFYSKENLKKYNE